MFPTSKQFYLSKDLRFTPVLTEAVITAEPGRESFVFLDGWFYNMCLLDDGWLVVFVWRLVFSLIFGKACTFTQTPMPKWNFTTTEDRKYFFRSVKKKKKGPQETENNDFSTFIFAEQTWVQADNS